MALKTVFLHPPSFDRLRRRAGARYPGQARGALVLVPDLARQPAALVPDSVLIDAPTDGLTLADVMRA